MDQMNTKNEPAFPSVSIGRHIPGMSLRDWFAGMAMNGCLQSVIKPGTPDSNEGAAKYCYAFADAMMKERDK